MSTVSVRYIVNSVEEAVAFYRDQLGFEVLMFPDPAFAMLTRDDLRLVLASRCPPMTTAAAPGRCPTAPLRPEGCNRIMIEVPDLQDTVERLRGEGMSFATTSSPGSAPRRSSWRTRRAIPSSCRAPAGRGEASS